MRNAKNADRTESTSARGELPCRASEPKPKVYKNYGEMAKNKADVAAFRAWSKEKGNWKAAKAFSDLDKSAKLTADDPARGTALKAIDAALKDYYASF